MGHPSYGGIFMVKREAYLQYGRENEWGPEDAERICRMEILGYFVLSDKGDLLYHLWQSEGNNSNFFNKELKYRNRTEFVKVYNMESEELRWYISEWNWFKRYSLFLFADAIYR